MNPRRKRRAIALMMNHQRGLCFYCGGRCYLGKELPDGYPPELVATLDHVVPRSSGGTDASYNLVVACVMCNEEKGSSRVTDFVSRKVPYIRRFRERIDSLLSSGLRITRLDRHDLNAQGRPNRYERKFDRSVALLVEGRDRFPASYDAAELKRAWGMDWN